MSRSTRLVDKIRKGESIPWPIATALSAATPIIRCGMKRRLRLPAERVTAYVISIGNITAGGTGKTPAVIERARIELSEGRRVAVLTRGYGAPNPAPAISQDIAPEQRYEMLGDEATLLLAKLPDLVVIKNPDRVAAAHLAIRRFDSRILILDDGYQFTVLERDENILVIDATNPFGNGHLIPRGILREPAQSMARATSIILTHCDQAKALSKTITAIREHCPDAHIRTTLHAPVSLIHVRTGRTESLDILRGQAIIAACAIGHPESFFMTLEALGAGIQDTMIGRDHKTIDWSVCPEGEMIVTTEKDAARINGPMDNLYALAIELKDHPIDEQE